MKRHLIDALFVLFPVTVLAVACTDVDATRSTLADMGFTDIETTGYDAWGCGKDDTCTGFEATNPNGRRVSGVVGCSRMGCGKGCTVRFK